MYHHITKVLSSPELTSFVISRLAVLDHSFFFVCLCICKLIMFQLLFLTHLHSSNQTWKKASFGKRILFLLSKEPHPFMGNSSETVTTYWCLLTIFSRPPDPSIMHTIKYSLVMVIFSFCIYLTLKCNDVYMYYSHLDQKSKEPFLVPTICCKKNRNLVKEMSRILKSGCGMEHIPTLLIKLSTMDSAGATVANMIG